MSAGNTYQQVKHRLQTLTLLLLQLEQPNVNGPLARPQAIYGGASMERTVSGLVVRPSRDHIGEYWTRV